MAGRCQAIIGTNFVNWALGNKNKWHWNQNKTIFIPEKENKNVVYKMGVLPSMCYCISYQSHTCMASKHLHRCVHGPLYRYVKLRVAHAPGMPGTFSTPPRVSDPDMHHGTCVTHVPWCMTGSHLAVSFEVGGGENVPGIPGACTTRKFTYLVIGPCN